MSESLQSSAVITERKPNLTSSLNVEPDFLTVGVVLYEWNASIRERVQRLGAVLGRTGIKIQLLNHTDLVKQTDKTQNLGGVVYQLPPDNSSPLAKRFEMIFNHAGQGLLRDCRIAAAFTIPDKARHTNIELGIKVSMACHVSQCQWLGLAHTGADSIDFQSWCEGLAATLRQLATNQSTLAA
ncbi:hypothetical protein [Alteromonas lipolytica]|uniref:Uncharacterized protein n=1 Tax=Alteromonas lipolytica TaxID=1856405 RepID=A0A1E8FGL3_9ALTE|nr:hypothetical protein [Alteromonas lipolytica]OFI35049.1 hypothetical protein BFC17_15975 [Alteromonas lipolytica]